MTAQLLLPTGSVGAGARLFWHAWLPEGAPKAVVLLVHGYAEHLGRYEYFAAKLNAQGIAVYALDHWGHGKSDGTKGFVPAFSAFTDGVELLLKEVESRHAGLPLFLIGHPMGGLIAALHLPTHQDHYAGAILSGPAVKATNEPSKLLIWISKFLSRFFPRMGVLPPVADGVSRDPAVVAAYKADPLNYQGKMGARMAKEIFEAMAEAQDGAADITLPLLLLHGEKDALTAPEGSQFLFENASSPDRQLKIYPELFHEIFNEPERDAVIADVTDWIGARLTKA